MGFQYFWKDIQSGHITVTSIDRCPPGHVRSDGNIRDGRSVRTPFAMMDRAPMTTQHATHDTAGRTRISDTSIMSDVLAAAPVATKDLAFKVQQTMLAADGARAAGRSVQPYVDQLRSHARSYGVHAFGAGEAGKAACERAAQSIMGAADAFEVMSNG